VSIEILGMAHVQLTVNDLQRAMPFYEKVLFFPSMRPEVKGPKGLYMIGGKTAMLVTRSSEEIREVGFDQRRIGLPVLPGPLAGGHRTSARVPGAGAGAGRARTGRGIVGAGVLLGAVRGSGGHPTRSEPCAGQGVVRGTV